MNIEEAIKKFLMDIVNFINDRRSIGKIEDVKFSYENDSLRDFLQIIRESVEIPNTLNTILKLIEKTITQEEFERDIIVVDFLRGNFDFKINHNFDKFKNRLRNFSFGDERGAVIQHSFFKEEKYVKKINLRNLDSDSLEKKIIEMIVYAGSLPSNDKNKTAFLKFLLSSNSNRILLIKKVNIDWAELYAYLYFKYLAKGYKTFYSQKIIYEYNPKSIEAEIASLSDKNLNFLQFFEILDVLDEYHHANDILSKYLKLYQIIEYLLIRVLLVEVQTKTQSHKQFIRELSGLKKHDDFDKKLFKNLFANDGIDNWFKNLVINKPKFKSEVEKYINKTISNNDNWMKIFSDLLYKLRNSIVHNKESELHLTIHTVSEESIDLMREIINHLEKILIKKIITFHNSITYISKCINLY